jgi:hypothetical protein
LNRLSKYTFLFISAVFVFIKLQQVFSIEPFIRESYAISWDNYGYYLHLPATLIYKDPGITEHWIDSLNNKYEPGRPFYQVWDGVNGRKVNVYPVGLAICNLPFFLAGHLFAKIFGYPPDGLSPPYQWAMIFSALFYAILGFWLLRKLLLRFFNDSNTSIVMALIAVGTNLYYYATYNDLLPHIHLFAVDCGILLLTIKWHERPDRKTSLYIGMLIGLATITRPSEIVWLIIPLLWNISGIPSLKEKMKLLARNFSHVLLLVFGMMAVGSIQLFYWKYTSGHWFSFNHTEGFDFFSPFTWKVLFSYKKGWLLYTPIMALAVAGLLLSWKWKKNLFIPFLLFFLANLWFISSWECWWYAGSFGQRAFVQSYGLMAIPLGYFIEIVSVKKVIRIFGSFILLFFVWLNLFQTWQMNNDILSDQLMTKDYYWKIFGRTEVKPEWRKLMEIDRGNAVPLDVDVSVKDPREIKIDIEHDGSIPQSQIIDSIGIPPMKYLKLNKDFQFGGVFRQKFSSLTSKDYLRVRYSVWVYVNDSSLNPCLISFAMIGRRGQTYGYQPVDITHRTEVGHRIHITADYITPVILHEDDELIVDVFNPGGSTIFMNEPEIEIYEPK